MKPARVAVMVMLFGVVLFGTHEVRAAEPSSAEVEARRHFEEGFKEFNLGEFRRAAEEYKLAYRAKPDPVFLYNVGQSYRLANDPTQALFFYKSFLRGMPGAPNRREVEDRIHKLEAQLSTNQAPPNVPMPPDQRPAEPAAEARKPAPEPSAAPPQPPSTPAPSTPEPATPAASQATPEVQTAAVVTDRPAKKPLYKKWWLWTTVGAVVVVGAGLGVGLAFGLAHHGAPSSTLGTTPIF